MSGVSRSDGGAALETVRIDRPATGGGVGRLGDGRVVFVRHSLPGETVQVRISETNAKFSRADAVAILEASSDRVAPPCSYARPGGCGGCDLQHASIEAQLEWKATLVREHLLRIARVERDVVVTRAPSPARASRTRLRCAVNESGELCLRASRSHDLVPVSSCWIADEAFAPAFATKWHGASEVELRAMGEDEPFAVVRHETHRGTTYEICSLRAEPLDPSRQSRVNVNGLFYTVSPRSFWQSHRDAPALLLDTVMEYLQPAPGDHAVDLFSGVGLFAVPIANAVGSRGRVAAVESSPFGARDARENARGLSQVRVREWSVSPRAINDTVGEGDLVVLDPPRSGLAKGVVQALVRRSPRRTVYVSCDAATFARDLRQFKDGGFTLRDVRAFDLFPMSEHVELVALLDTGA